jgi:hypothetical protein
MAEHRSAMRPTPRRGLSREEAAKYIGVSATNRSSRRSPSSPKAKEVNGPSMAKKLLYTWIVGADRHTHAGFAIYTIGKLNSPGKNISEPYDEAEKAVESAELLGEGYAVFRIVESNSGIHPRELIEREDLPVSVDLN